MCLSKKSFMIVSSQIEPFSISPSKRVLPPKESSSFIAKSQCFELFSKRVFFFFISKSQCRELLPKRIISLLKLLMPSTPSIENFFFLKLSMVMHPWRIHQISKNLHAMYPLKDFQNLQFWFSFNRYVHAMQSDMKCYLKVQLIIFLRYT